MKFGIFTKLLGETILILLLFQGVTDAAYFETVPMSNGEMAIRLTGTIEQNDREKFFYHYNTSSRNGRPITFLLLDSHGGNVFEGEYLATIVRSYSLQTYIEEERYCESSCFLIFAAGVKRYASIKAYVSVHSVSEMNGEETVDSMALTLHMQRYLSGLEVPPEILGMLGTTPPKYRYLLTKNDLERMGVVFLYPQQTTSQETSRPSPSEENKRMARSLNEKAKKLIDPKKDPDPKMTKVAIDILLEAAKIFPGDSEILGNLGYALYQAGYYKQAKQILLFSLSINPKRGASLVNLGQSVAELGDINWATDCFVQYFRYSKKKKAAKEQLYFFADNRNSSKANLKRAATNAISKLDLVRQK